MAEIDDQTRTSIEAAVFRRLVEHLRHNPDIQNIDLMIHAGFCRNCLGDWFKQEAAERGLVLNSEESRGLIYGMPPSEWKKRHQKEATATQLAAMAEAQARHHK